MDIFESLSKYTIPELVQKTVELHISNPCMGFYYEEPISYGELIRRIIVVSHTLKENGVKKGSKVAIIGENSPNWVIAYLSTVFLGGIAVPILPDFHSKDINNILRHSESEVLFATHFNLQRLLGYDLGGVKYVISLDDFTPEENPIEIKGLSSLIQKAKDIVYSVGQKMGLISEEVGPEDVAAIIYTSGTSGNSKGVMLTHKNIVSNVFQVSKLFDLTEKDRCLSILPLAHSYEFTLGLMYVLSAGACVYYLGKKPTPSTIEEAAKKAKPTVIAAVPLFLEKVYKAKVKKLIDENKTVRMLTRVPVFKKVVYSRVRKALLDFFGGYLRCITLGGAPLTYEVEVFLKQIKFPYALGYGLTEASPLVSGSLSSETKLSSSGKVAPLIEVKIVNPDPASGVGEIWLKGPNIMKGYYKNENLTKEVLTEDGWLKTGDLGFLDSDGYIYIKGRTKNMILTATGENIYPENIEEKLDMHPWVEESVVFEKNGRIVAKVYLNYESLEGKLEGHSETEREQVILSILNQIRDDVNQELPRYSRIYELYEYPQPFEKTPTNKIKRFLYIT
ncbi:MAG TPA: AMP-binding protein [Candidatus Hydrothermia bacterium]|nr:AMP-binding protein [Candidatus Hydrothermae bacterium]MDD3649438.1 AMP-binding protein [Candidatus Hydrothermia bacterium]MDD5572816.1 AMP-binding protein [Candidatus Hydrothermia bacterium]HOK22844.1 AMP-binding protein [Candidatus Hydrothermia bacterium]HOL23553.1 AMP-binding protein [Candidatus Hydrothermia bacterium]